MTTLQISPRILHWAADKSGLSIDALVDLLGKPQKHNDLLAGKFAIEDAEKLAKKVHIPFGYLFLEQPPEVKQVVFPDLRQVPDHEPLSPDFYAVLNDVIRKQQWHTEYLQEHGAERLEFVGKFSYESQLQAETVANDILKTLVLTDLERQKCKDYKAFFSLLSAKAEEVGILVFKNSIVKSNTRQGLSVSEFRGFAIADEYTPAIFINGKDSEAAWVFTLAHEIAHIWLGETGVSDIPAKKYKRNKVEAFCNRIAAELLTPKEKFLKAWENEAEPRYGALSKQFKVSQLVIARRALDLGKIDWQSYQRVADQSQQKKKSNGGAPYNTIPVRNSKRLTRTLVTQAMSGQTMLREAASLLNVQPDTVMELSRRLGIR